jgi:hypothetical protein
MAPGAERFLRFRVPRLERQPNDLFVRPARATDLPLIAEFCRKDAIGLMGMPDVQACGEVSTISGYAVWGTEAGILGGFYYACEGKYLSVLEPSFVGVPDYFKWLLAARLMALQNCSQVIDIPVPIHQIHMIFSIRAAGGLALHRSSIGLSQRIF